MRGEHSLDTMAAVPKRSPRVGFRVLIDPRGIPLTPSPCRAGAREADLTYGTVSGQIIKLVTVICSP